MTAIPRLFDVFSGRLRLEGMLISRTGLHIGAGASGDPLATDAAVVRDGLGRPFIPGSSLKGVLRSAAEALLRDPAQKVFARGESEKLRACNPLAGKDGVCVDHKQLEEWRKTLVEDLGKDSDISRPLAERVWRESCSVCRIFGSTALAGRVRFPDLPLVGDTPSFELRNGVGIDRAKGNAADGILYDFEAVPPETSFRLTLIFDNYDDWEVGLLLYLFEELNCGNLLLGGKTTRGLGSMRVIWDKWLDIQLQVGNPFGSMLSDVDLLKPVEVAATSEVAVEDTTHPNVPEAEIGNAWPSAGTPELWQRILIIFEEKGPLRADQMGPHGTTYKISRADLDMELHLGLGERRKEAWPLALEMLVASGHLIAEDGLYRIAAAAPVASDVPDVSPVEMDAPAEIPPALRPLYDRFVGAIGRRWEEERCSIVK